MKLRKIVLNNRRFAKIAVAVILVLFISLPIAGYAGDVEVLLSGDRLKQDLDIAHKVMRPIGRLSKAGFTIQNRSNNLYNLEYQAVWFDQYMQTVSTGTWQRFTLPPNMGKGVVSIGKSQEASIAVFQIRLPHDGVINGSNLGKEHKYENSNMSERENSDNK